MTQVSQSTKEKTDKLFHISGLTKRVGARAVFQNISLDIDKNVKTAIVGESDFGTTALLRCLSFVEIPTSGRLFLNGEQIFDTVTPLIAMRIESLKQQIEECVDNEQRQMLFREINEIKVSFLEQKMREKLLRKSYKKNKLFFQKSFGLVLHSFNLLPNLTAQQNIILPAVKKKLVEKGAAEGRASELLEKFGLTELAPKYPNFLSNIETIKIATLGALMHSPKVLVLDQVDRKCEDIDELIEFLSRAQNEVESIVFSCANEEMLNRFADVTVNLEKTSTDE